MDQCKPSRGAAMNARLACSANFAISAFQVLGIARLKKWSRNVQRSRIPISNLDPRTFKSFNRGARGGRRDGSMQTESGAAMNARLACSANFAISAFKGLGDRGIDGMDLGTFSGREFLVSNLEPRTFKSFNRGARGGRRDGSKAGGSLYYIICAISAIRS